MANPSSGYGQYCPTARALEVLGERWTLLILRDLLCGRTRFNDLARSQPGLSRSLLAKRLRQLEQAEVVERLDGEYLLTDAGRDLEPIVFGIGEWGAKWTFGEPDEDELDAEVLSWWMQGRLDCSVLPDRRIVLHVRYTDDPGRFWFVIEDGSASVCVSDPGYEVDLTLTSDLRTMYRVWLGHLPLKRAMRDGALAVDGQRALVRVVPELLMLSPIAPAVAAHAPAT